MQVMHSIHDWCVIDSKQLACVNKVCLDDLFGIVYSIVVSRIKLDGQPDVQATEL